MSAPRAVLRYEDYAALPDDGKRYEVHEGALSVTPAPGVRHQDVAGRLYAALLSHLDARGRGRVFIAPVDVILSNTTIVQPDIVYVAGDRATLISERGIEGAPTLVIEVLSPSTTGTDRGTKMRLYARYDVPHYWIVDPPAQTIEAYALMRAGYAERTRATGGGVLRADPLAELAIQTASLWA